MSCFKNYTFAQLEQMVLERDSMIFDRDEQIEKLELKIQKKRQIIVDLKKRIVDKPLVEALFEEETESEDEAVLEMGGDMTKAEMMRSEEHTSELQSPCNLVCRLLLEKKK